MSIEYHGWIVLATSQDDWDDGDFENAFCRVEGMLERLCPEEGHEALLADCAILPKVVYLKGVEVDSIDVVTNTLAEIGLVFDRAYGELAVLEETDRDECWSPSHIIRYLLVDGELADGDRRMDLDRGP